MNYLITITHWKLLIEHYIKGLDMNEIHTLFVANSIKQCEDDYIFHGDLVAWCEYNGKQFQIISSFHTILDLYGYLTGIIATNPTFKLSYVNSISQPLSDEKSKELVVKLQEKSAEVKKAITPNVIALVESMNTDVRDFISRFTGYIKENDADVLESRMHDIYMYMDQWKLANVKETMGRLIEKMEILESDYIKSINTDGEQPLDQFNRELNAIMNQNRLFRDHSLNQLSGGTSFDFIVFKLRSYRHMLTDAISAEVKSYEHILQRIIKFLHIITLYALVLTITILFVLQEIWWWNMDIPFLECGCIGLCILLIFWFKNARRYIAAPISALCIFVTYIWYQAILVNFWL